MAVTATVDKFGMTFSSAYHKISRLTYESYDAKELIYSEPGEIQFDEEGVPIPPVPTPPVESWTKKNTCYFEVATYASDATREAHAEPIYRSTFNFELSAAVEADDIIVQAYAHLKSQVGYEDAVDC